jgi:hypothetical protein
MIDKTFTFVLQGIVILTLMLFVPQFQQRKKQLKELEQTLVKPDWSDSLAAELEMLKRIHYQQAFILRIAFSTILGMIPGFFIAIVFADPMLTDPVLTRMTQVAIGLGTAGGLLNSLYLYKSQGKRELRMVQARKRSFLLARDAHWWSIFGRGFLGLLIGCASALLAAKAFNLSWQSTVDVMGTIAPIITLAGAMWPYIPWWGDSAINGSDISATEPAISLWTYFWQHIPFVIILGVLVGIIDASIDGTLWSAIGPCFIGQGACLLTSADFQHQAIRVILQSMIFTGCGVVTMWVLWVIGIPIILSINQWFKERIVTQILILAFVGIMVVWTLSVITHFNVQVEGYVFGGICGGTLPFLMKNNGKIRHRKSPAYSWSDASMLIIYSQLIVFAYLIPSSQTDFIVPPDDRLGLRFSLTYYIAAVIFMAICFACITGLFSRKFFDWASAENRELISTGALLVFPIVEFLFNILPNYLGLAH